MDVEELYVLVFFFFFQAEDGIRDVAVTGVQTCALPISFMARARMKRSRARPERPRIRITLRGRSVSPPEFGLPPQPPSLHRGIMKLAEIGRASCRERV